MSEAKLSTLVTKSLCTICFTFCEALLTIILQGSLFSIYIYLEGGFYVQECSTFVIRCYGRFSSNPPLIIFLTLIFYVFPNFIIILLNLHIVNSTFKISHIFATQHSFFFFIFGHPIFNFLLFCPFIV